MKAMTYSRYGDADVVRPADLPCPTPGPDDILVRVHATGVTTADWRLRAAAFPGILAIPGRLMFGLTRPRQPVLGMDFSGTVEATGTGVTRFRPGDRVFGLVPSGAHAEYLVVPQTGVIAHRPEGLDHAHAAALPWGALSALVFLRDVAGLSPTDKVLIVGASGGVGIYATQIARALGADVTAVAGSGRGALLRDLGAHEVIDYRKTDPATLGRRFDIVLDTVGAMSYRAARRVLLPGGRFVPLNFGIREMLSAIGDTLRSTRIRIAVSGDKREDLETLAGMVASGQLRPVIDSLHDFDDIRDAYRKVEGRHRAGAVVLTVLPEEPLIAAA